MRCVAQIPSDTPDTPSSFFFCRRLSSSHRIAFRKGLTRCVCLLYRLLILLTATYRTRRTMRQPIQIRYILFVPLPVPVPTPMFTMSNATPTTTTTTTSHLPPHTSHLQALPSTSQHAPFKPTISSRRKPHNTSFVPIRTSLDHRGSK